ncbi:MAG: hypothetical protein HYT81_10400 [Gemmatimonadetes bacterium]|nr:hypothetical protein [Gemmatimonadota bacterium]MBI2404112.1 hypothetical protein [Gemmatimonadota bacterium]
MEAMGRVNKASDDLLIVLSIFTQNFEEMQVKETIQLRITTVWLIKRLAPTLLGMATTTSSDNALKEKDIGRKTQALTPTSFQSHQEASAIAIKGKLRHERRQARFE